MSRSYEYQYDTNPRKIKPEYDRSSKKKTTAKKKSVAKKPKKDVKKDSKSTVKVDAKTLNKARFQIGIKSIALVGILFIILFRNSQINESFAKIQALKAEKTSIQKINDQLEINIQNSLNLNNVEQAAKELLGMQKLTNKQTRYISLPKKDYVETKAEEVIIEEKEGFAEKLIEKIGDIF